MLHKWAKFFLLGLILSIFNTNCATMGGSGSQDYSGKQKEGSDPVNRAEMIAYKQAIIRCHKTGGTRIVKIKGVLQCF